MTAQATPMVHAQASVNVRSLVLSRAKWVTTTTASGDGRRPGLGMTPVKGTWYGHVVRTPSEVIVVPFVACPSCGGVLALPHTEQAAKALSYLMGQRIPRAHNIDHLGQVSPDVQCMHAKKGRARCDFHRKVILDRWNKTKPLYAIAYINMSKGAFGEIEIAYSHAIDAREARTHLGKGNYQIIGAGPAIGLFADERSGKVSVE